MGRKGIVGLVLAGAGVAGVTGGIVAERAMIRAQRQRPDRVAGVDTGLRPDVIGRVLTMSDVADFGSSNRGPVQPSSFSTASPWPPPSGTSSCRSWPPPGTGWWPTTNGATAPRRSVGRA